MSIKKSILLRARISFLVVLLFGMGIVYRIAVIQVVEGEEWRAMAQTIGLQVMPIQATRGNIYSDNGGLLSTSLPFYMLAMDPYLPSDGLYKSNIDSLSILLSKFYKDQPPHIYKKRINEARKSKKRYYLINRQEIGYQEMKMIQQWPIFREGRLKGGIIFEKVEKRFLPFSHLGYRTIGTVNSDNKGVTGLEFSFNHHLSGKDGEALFQKMSGGGWRPVNDGNMIQPVEGLDIQTTLNINLQDITENALLGALKHHQADYGVAIVMEVATGEIKAISNLSRNEEGKYLERYNYAVGAQGSREPGSTFKLASMIALLEDKNMSLTDTVNTGKGELKFYNQTMRDHKPGGYGVLTLQEVFEVSSNIGVAKLVTRQFGSDPKRFINYIRDIGLTEPIAFQMAGEGKAYIKDPSDSSWSGISLPWMSHGYELRMTPLHTLMLYNAVANDGKMIQPIIVKSIMKDEKVVERFKAKVINDKICSQKTLKKIQMMLEGVVERGTAANINQARYKIAGKTGTAKKAKDGKYTNEYYTSFVGYFPAAAPKYSCIVVIDNPKGYKIYGSDVSAPVFKEIADKIYATEVEMHDLLADQKSLISGVFPMIRSGNQSELTMLCNEMGISNHAKSTEAEWVTTETSGNSIYWRPNHVALNKIPDVRGMTLRDAIYLLENAGLQVNYSGSGRVESQSITAGTKVQRNQKINLKLG